MWTQISQLLTLPCTEYPSVGVVVPSHPSQTPTNIWPHLQRHPFAFQAIKPQKSQYVSKMKDSTHQYKSRIKHPPGRNQFQRGHGSYSCARRRSIPELSAEFGPAWLPGRQVVGQDHKLCLQRRQILVWKGGVSIQITLLFRNSLTINKVDTSSSTRLWLSGDFLRNQRQM